MNITTLAAHQALADHQPEPESFGPGGAERGKRLCQLRFIHPAAVILHHQNLSAGGVVMHHTDAVRPCLQAVTEQIGEHLIQQCRR